MQTDVSKCKSKVSFSYPDLDPSVSSASVMNVCNTWADREENSHNKYGIFRSFCRHQHTRGRPRLTAGLGTRFLLTSDFIYFPLPSPAPASLSLLFLLQVHRSNYVRRHALPTYNHSYRCCSRSYFPKNFWITSDYNWPATGPTGLCHYAHCLLSFYPLVRRVGRRLVSSAHREPDIILILMLLALIW